MKQLTKKQRREVYKKALEIIASPEKLWWGCWEIKGICHAIAHTLKIDRFDHTEFLISFPEFKLFKPDEFGSFWFSNKEERIAVLQFCIEMTR